jgi:conjugal transfer pilus assembly protein TraE
MQIAHQKSRLQQLIAQRNGYLVLAVGLVGLTLLLATGLCRLIGRERIVIVPPVVEQAFWVDAKTISPTYLSQMTVFFAQLRLNVTPSSAAYQRDLLLRYTDPRYYGDFKNELVAEADHLAQTHTSLIFYPVDVAVDVPHLTATVSGDFSATVGTVLLPVKRLTYQLTYRYAQGRLWLRSFQEITESQPSTQPNTQEDMTHV